MIYTDGTYNYTYTIIDNVCVCVRVLCMYVCETVVRRHGTTTRGT